jgi:hypothetical protein
MRAVAPKEKENDIKSIKCNTFNRRTYKFALYVSAIIGHHQKE